MLGVRSIQLIKRAVFTTNEIHPLDLWMAPMRSAMTIEESQLGDIRRSQVSSPIITDALQCGSPPHAPCLQRPPPPCHCRPPLPSSFQPSPTPSATCPCLGSCTLTSRSLPPRAPHLS